MFCIILWFTVSQFITYDNIVEIVDFSKENIQIGTQHELSARLHVFYIHHTHPHTHIYNKNIPWPFRYCRLSPSDAVPTSKGENSIPDARFVLDMESGNSYQHRIYSNVFYVLCYLMNGTTPNLLDHTFHIGSFSTTLMKINDHTDYENPGNFFFYKFWFCVYYGHNTLCTSDTADRRRWRRGE